MGNLDTWETKSLGDLAKMITGKTPPTSVSEYFSGNILWVTPADFKSKEIFETTRTLTQKAIDDKKCNLLPANCIILNCIGDVGKVSILRKQGSSNQQITALLPKDDLEVNFLYYLLLTENKNLKNLANEAVVPILNNERLKTLKISFPSIPTQKRISEILDKADTLRKKDKQLLQYYNDLAQSLFIDMFGDPVRNKKGSPLSDLVNVNPTKSEARLQDSDLVTFVSMSAVGETGEFDQSCIKKYQDVKSGFTYFRENDVLFAKITPCMENGKGAIARNLQSGVGFGSTEFHVFRPNETISPEFLYHLFALPTFRKYAEINMSGSAGQKRVGLGFFKKVKINPPSIAQQNRFAAQVKNIEKQKEKLKAQMQESENLFQALLQKAFNGGLN